MHQQPKSRFRFRFKTRSLLIATAVVGIVAGYYSNLLVKLSRERAALESLNSDWSIQSSFGKLNLANPEQTVGETIRDVLHWPVRKWKRTNTERCTELLLAGRGLDQKSLEPVRSLTKLRSLRIFDNGLRNAEIDADELRYLSGLNDLRILQIDDARLRSGALQHLTGLQLKTFICDCDYWGDEEFDAIAKLTTLEWLVIRTNPPNFEKLSTLPSLVHLNTKTNPDLSFDSFQKFPALSSLVLSGDITIEQIDSLRGVKNLSSLSLKETNVDESFIDSILAIPKLQKLEFGRTQISLDGYKRMQRPNLAISFLALKAMKTDENVLAYEDEYNEVDLDESNFIAYLRLEQQNLPSYYLRISTTTKHQFYQPIVNPPEFEFGDDWRALAGKEISLSDEAGYFPDSLPAVQNFNVKFLEREGNVFHLKWSFTSVSGSERCWLDARIPLSGVTVVSKNPFTLGEAKLHLSRFFNVDDFEEPEQTGSKDSRDFRFTMKPDRD